MADELAQYKAKAPANNELSQYAAKAPSASASQARSTGEPTGAQPFGSPTSVHDSLIRTFGNAGQAIIGLPGSIYHSFADAPTAEERQQFGVSANPDLMERAALGAGRMAYKPVTTAASDYAHGRVGVDDALSVADQAIGSAGGQVIAGKLGEVAPEAMRGVAPPVIRGVAKAINTAGAKFPKATGAAIGAGTGATAGALTGTPYLTEAGASAGGLIGGLVGEEVLPKIKVPGERFGFGEGDALNAGLKRAETNQPFKPNPTPDPALRPAGPTEFSSINAPKPVAAAPVETPANATWQMSGPSEGESLKANLARANANQPLPQPVRASAPSPIERASGVSAPTPTSAKPVEAPATAKPSGPAKPSRVDYQFGEHASKFDPRNPEHTRIMEMRHSELAEEANRLKVDGKTDWNEKDMSRSTKATGKASSPNAQKVRGQLLDEQNGEVPPGLARTGADTSRDITSMANKDLKAPSRGVANAKDVSVDPKFEFNMRQRAKEATAAREKLGPIGLASQQPTPKPVTIGPEYKPKDYYNKYGKLK